MRRGTSPLVVIKALQTAMSYLNEPQESVLNSNAYHIIEEVTFWMQDRMFSEMKAFSDIKKILKDRNLDQLFVPEETDPTLEAIQKVMYDHEMNR